MAKKGTAIVDEVRVHVWEDCESQIRERLAGDAVDDCRELSSGTVKNSLQKVLNKKSVNISV